MDDAARMQIAHALTDLLGHQRCTVQVETISAKVNVRVQCVALAQGRDNGLRLHAGAHEQHNVFVARLLECSHLGLIQKKLQLKFERFD